MAWSTREVAVLAGTTLRAVRHYHQVGLLAEPERETNGYKQYTVPHLVRLIRITRLTDLGFSLSKIGEMGESDDHPEQALRTLDDELAATIERLQRVRIQLALILRQAAPTDMPPELAPVTADAELSDNDRSMVIVMSRVLGPIGLKLYADMLRDLPVNPVTAEFDDLPDDANERTRRQLAERLTPYVRALRARHPGLGTPGTDARHGPRFVEQTVRTALHDLYNPAQLDVVRRTEQLLHDPSDP